VNAVAGAVSRSPAHSEQDVKATLDSCRLTYLYEPDWPRLRDRVSRILSGGMLVAWFQGGFESGPDVVPGRTVICDPSNRWARENVNRFLRQLPIETSIPLVAATGEAPWHEGSLRPQALQRSIVNAAWRPQFAGAIDRQGYVEVQGINECEDGHLFELIRDHQVRTGVPALVAVPFCAPAEPVVCTPRDAIRTMFSSPMDVLVIERFVVAKDHHGMVIAS
jgi:carbamoyltransferase